MDRTYNRLTFVEWHFFLYKKTVKVILTFAWRNKRIELLKFASLFRTEIHIQMRKLKDIME